MLVFSCVSCESNHSLTSKHEGLFPATIPTNICYLRTKRKAKILGMEATYNATGTIIEGKYIVTAAHNLYDSWKSNLIEVEVIYKSSIGEVKTSTITKEEIQRTRKTSHYTLSYPTDYAFLRLGNAVDIADSVKINTEVSINDIKNIKVAGYPDGTLLYGSGAIIRPIPNDATFYYAVDTVKGMSGGPVWTEFNSEDLLVGIHVSEGRARLIDPNLIDDFEKWKKLVR